MRRASVLVVLILVISAGCARLPATPTETVEAYFRNLKRDPSRNLPLLTPEFHDRHGISMAAVEGWLWGDYLFMDPVEREAPIEALAPVDATRGRDAWEFAWLQVQVEGRLRKAVMFLEPEFRAPVALDDGRVEVQVKVRVEGSFGFVQVFRLKQEGAAGWRIDEIEQRGVQLRDVLIAFSAHPQASLIPAVKAASRPENQSF